MIELGAFRQALVDFGIQPDPSMIDRFAAYKMALYAWNSNKNLTRVNEDECEVRHFLDSALFHDLIPQGATVLDIGSGPGLPGWVLANIRPDIEVTALDSSGKMLDFLRTQPLPNLFVVEDRAEEWGQNESFDAVTGRALAPLSLQLELSCRPCKIGGVIIPMRTPNDEEEIQRLKANPFGLELETVARRDLPILGAPRVVPVFRKVSRTPSEFPRRWSDMKRKPI